MDNLICGAYFLTMELDLQPTLRGELLELKPLSTTDFSVLYAVASDPLVWEQHPHKERYQPSVFESFFEQAIQSGGALIASRRDTNQVIGSSRFYDFNPSKKQIAIGYTFLARECWGHTFNREMKHLMLHHAFRFVDSVIFHIGETNIRSQRAIEKIGATLIERAPHQLPDGTPYMELLYQIQRRSITLG